MKKHLLKALLAPALLFAVACEDMPTAPAADEAPEALFVPGPSLQLETTDGKTALRWAAPLDADVQVAKKMGESGGVVAAPPGIEVVIPEDALDMDGRKNITILSRAGEDVAFEFGPHGLEFSRMVKVRIHLNALVDGDEILEGAMQTYLNGDAPSSDRIKLGSITAIYYANQDGQMVKVLQTFDVFVVKGMYLEFETDHFSGYALAA